MIFQFITEYPPVDYSWRSREDASGNRRQTGGVYQIGELQARS